MSNQMPCYRFFFCVFKIMKLCLIIEAVFTFQDKFNSPRLNCDILFVVVINNKVTTFVDCVDLDNDLESLISSIYL